MEIFQEWFENLKKRMFSNQIEQKKVIFQR